MEIYSHRDLMLATPAAKSFDRAGWIFELKSSWTSAIANAEVHNRSA